MFRSFRPFELLQKCIKAFFKNTTVFSFMSVPKLAFGKAHGIDIALHLQSHHKKYNRIISIWFISNFVIMFGKRQRTVCSPPLQVVQTLHLKPFSISWVLRCSDIVWYKSNPVTHSLSTGYKKCTSWKTLQWEHSRIISQLAVSHFSSVIPQPVYARTQFCLCEPDWSPIHCFIFQLAGVKLTRAKKKNLQWTINCNQNFCAQMWESRGAVGRPWPTASNLTLVSEPDKHWKVTSPAEEMWINSEINRKTPVSIVS